MLAMQTHADAILLFILLWLLALYVNTAVSRGKATITFLQVASSQLVS